MNILKNSIRYGLSRFTTSLGMRETFRSFYLNKAHNYILNLSPEAVRSVWIRRSVTNQDFSPFLSDVDLTMVVDENSVNKIHLPHDLLVKDIQIIPESFLETWIEAGGFRNYLQDEWISLRGMHLFSHRPQIQNDETLAFDLGHEIYLLYHQLENKLHSFGDPYTKHARKKIFQDLTKIKKFWFSKDTSVLRQAREDFEVPDSTNKFMIIFSQFCNHLMDKLHSPLNSFRCSELMSKDFGDYFEVSLEIVGKPVIAVRDPQNFISILNNHPSHFVAPESFIDLVKGVGVQEQTLLNQLVKDKTSHYFKFNQQRLALDLVSAVVQFPDNHGQLYYCFKNIQDFVKALDKPKDAPDWTKIDNLWKSHGLVAHNTAELFRLNKAYLEVLRTMG